MTSWDICTGLSIVDVLRQRSELDPDAPFCQFGQGGWHTYGDLWSAARATAAGLTSLGVSSGDRVSVFMSKRFEYLSTLFAAMTIGAVYAPASTDYDADQLAMVLSDCAPAALVTDRPHQAIAEQAVAQVPGLRTVVVCADDATGGAAVPVSGSATSQAVQPRVLAPDEPAVIMYTSGTTGKPKGVTFSHGNVMHVAMFKSHALSAHDRGFDFLPLHHFNGGLGQVVPMVYRGGSVVFADDFDPAGFVEQLRGHGVTVSSVNSNHVLALLDQPAADSDRDHGCRHMTLGLKLHASTHRAFEHRFGTRLLGVYGLTETVGQFIQEPREYLTSPYSSGRVLPGYEVAIVDEEGKQLGPGETGEAIVRSTDKHAFFIGYWNDQEKTSQMIRDGWMRTGDLGLMEEDGRFVYLQRTADLARRRGKRTAPSQTEDLIRGHPAVHDTAVIGLADDPDHETLAALVVLKRDGDPDQLQVLAELRQLCADQANSLLVPDHLLAVETLPKVMGALGTPRWRENGAGCGFAAGWGCWRSVAGAGGFVRVSGLAGRVRAGGCGGAAVR